MAKMAGTFGIKNEMGQCDYIFQQKLNWVLNHQLVTVLQIIGRGV